MKSSVSTIVSLLIVLVLFPLVGICASLGNSTASEQNSQAQAHESTLMLRGYLIEAALNNPGLEAVFNHWKAALERVPQAKTLPDPRFSYRYFIQEIETRVGPQRQAFEISHSGRELPMTSRATVCERSSARVAAIPSHTANRYPGSASTPV